MKIDRRRWESKHDQTFFQQLQNAYDIYY